MPMCVCYSERHAEARPHFAVVVASLTAQLQAGPNNTKLVQMVHFNQDNAVDATKCTDVQWVPTMEGSLFVSAHAGGSLYVYQRVRPLALVPDV